MTVVVVVVAVLLLLLRRGDVRKKRASSSSFVVVDASTATTAGIAGDALAPVGRADRIAPPERQDGRRLGREPREGRVEAARPLVLLMVQFRSMLHSSSDADVGGDDNVEQAAVLRRRRCRRSRSRRRRRGRRGAHGDGPARPRRPASLVQHLIFSCLSFLDRPVVARQLELVIQCSRVLCFFFPSPPAIEVPPPRRRNARLESAGEVVEATPKPREEETRHWDDEQ